MRVRFTDITTGAVVDTLGYGRRRFRWLSVCCDGRSCLVLGGVCVEGAGAGGQEEGQGHGERGGEVSGSEHGEGSVFDGRVDRPVDSMRHIVCFRRGCPEWKRQVA